MHIFIERNTRNVYFCSTQKPPTGTVMRKFVYFLLVNILFCCCLEPSGDNLVKIEQPDLNAISINLAEVGNDTIFIDRDTEFKYEVQGYPLQATEVEVRLNDTPVYAP